MKSVLMLLSVMLFPIAAVAQTESSKPYYSEEKFEKAWQASDEDMVWGTRIVNARVIADHLIALEMLAWCSAQTKGRHDACALVAPFITHTEKDVREAIPINEMMLNELLDRMSPSAQRDAHVEVIKSQLKELKELPTPLMDAVRGKMRELRNK